jgi:hypothetical protein
MQGSIKKKRLNNRTIIKIKNYMKRLQERIIVTLIAFLITLSSLNAADKRYVFALGGFPTVNGVADPGWGANWVDYRLNDVDRIMYIWSMGETISATPAVGVGSLGQTDYSAFIVNAPAAWWGCGYYVGPVTGNQAATMDMTDVTSDWTFHFAIRTDCTSDITVMLSGSTQDPTDPFVNVSTSAKIVLNKTNFPLTKRDKTQWVEFNIPMTQLMTGSVVATNNLRYLAPINKVNYVSFLGGNDKGCFVAWDAIYIYQKDVIITSQTSLNFKSIKNEGSSAEKSFTVKGELFSSDITLTPSTNLEISKTSGSGFTNSPISLTLSSGKVDDTTVYVRLKAGLDIGNYTDSILISSPQAETKKISCSGNVIPLVADAGSDKIIICGGTAQLDTVTTNYTGTGTFKYKWTPATGLNNDTIANPTATVTSNTTYTVTVTTPNLSSASDTVDIIVNSLTANAGSDKIIICGGTVQLDSVKTNYTGTGTLKYKWTPSAGLNIDTIANPTATITSNTTYTVTVNTPNGCSASDNVQVTVNSLTANAGVDKSFICGTPSQLNVTTNYSGTGILKYKWSPSDGLNSDTISNPVATPFKTMNYTVTVTTPNDCSASDNVNVQPIVAGNQQIRLVGVDSNNKNVVVWNNKYSTYIDSVYLYKETNVSDIYNKIGSAPYLSMMFIDTLSNPNQNSNRYKITLKDKCGFETSSSDPHKTVHLSINQGMSNSWNLIWEPYTGFTVSTYNIYRGTTLNNLALFSSISGNTYQFSDYNPPLGYVYYQIEVVPPASQLNAPFIGEKVMAVTNFTTSRSNIATNNITGISDLYSDNNYFSVYPNPAKDEVLVSIESNNQSTIKIYNLVGSLIKTESANGSSTHINLSDIPNNLYIIEVSSGNKIGRQKFVIQK